MLKMVKNKNKTNKKDHSIFRLVLSNPLTIVVIVVSAIIIIILIAIYLFPYFMYKNIPDKINKEYIIHRVERLTNIKDPINTAVLRIKSEDIKEYNDIYKDVKRGDYLIKSGESSPQIIIYDDFQEGIIKYQN
ncbi:MAG: hypothetical protein QM532_02180 [Cyanobium sp. MAG06]|nr:hypothetical protein [Cyanobium sp. MAG06]